MSVLLLQTLNGLSLSAVLFMISVGFSIIIGLMRIVNLSHATLFVLGAHVAISVVRQFSGSFIMGLVGGAVLVGLLGVLIERFLISRMYGKHFQQVLLTMGLMFIIDDLTLLIWEGYPIRNTPPALFSGSMSFAGIIFPRYRMFMICVGIIAAIIMWFLVERTKFGAIIRAGADNSEMVQAIGINISVVFLLAFGFGVFLAGLAGVLSSPMIGMQSGMSMEFLTMAIVVITVGGVGSLPGVIVGSLFVGMIDSFGRSMFPDLSYFTMFVPMVLVLIIRPQGLLGKVVLQ